MIIVTGGAGFIVSCVVRTLNDAGRDDIIIVDNIAETDKWMNMRNKHFIKYVTSDDARKREPRQLGARRPSRTGSERKNLLQVPDCYRDGDDSQKK